MHLLRETATSNRAEVEADRIAGEVLRRGGPALPGQPPLTVATHRPVEVAAFGRVRRGPVDPIPQEVSEALREPGTPLDTRMRASMESHLRHDLGGVRIHDGPAAAAAARALGARAFTVGRDVGFAAGEYRPGEVSGYRLLAHELAHVVQQQGREGVVQRSPYTSPLYTPEERREMAEGRVRGTDTDRDLAIRFGFRPGDIVFRLGSRQLADRIGDPVTHGGIYLGDGLIHDMVGFGNRNVRVSDFYREAADPNVVKVIRFTGPLAHIIVSRVVENVLARNFDLPTDPIPWNLFSSADDYRTATCLEYSHAQFLHAIRQIAGEMFWSAEVHEELSRTYFRSGGVDPDPLIRARRLTVGGAMGVAVNERRLLIAAADYLAEDVDSSVFQNRWEGRSELRNVGTSWHPVFWQEEILETFTYRSFVDARRFFRVVR